MGNIKTGHIIQVGMVSETNTALPVNVEKTVQIGQVIETDTALPVTVVKINNAIEASSQIPYDAKEAISNFVYEQWEKFEEVISKIEDISDLLSSLFDLGVKVPEKIIEFMPELLKILKYISGG